MAVTLVIGYVCARSNEISGTYIFLGIAHATVGFLLLLVVPDAVTHHLTVGPGWYAH